MIGRLVFAALAASMIAAPALAEGYSLSQLLQSGFQVKAASPVAGRCVSGPLPSCASEILFLQGQLSSSGQPILVRCVITLNPDDGSERCQRVY
jgi:hypothetical protein